MNNNSKYKPPHLPQDLQIPMKTHNRVGFFLMLFVILLLSGLSAVATSLSVIAWLSPPIILDKVLFVDSLGKDMQNINPNMLQQTKQRTVSIYDSRQMIGMEFYKEDAFIADSIIISSDGWSAIYKPDYVSGEEIFWDAIDYQGESHKIENSVFDKNTGILYLNYEGNGFRVVSFMNLADLDHIKSAVLYKRDGSKKILLGDKYKIIENKNFSILELQYRFLKDSDFSVNSVLFTDGGEFLGFVGLAGLVEGWQVEVQLLSLLSKGSLRENNLDISGFIVEEVFDKTKWKKIDSFYVSDIGIVSNQNFKVGDLITKVSGQPVDKFNLARQVLQTSVGSSFTILRNGGEIEVLLK
ncbi:MAG: hypothetical protein L3J07_00490 [Candidatus Magasanikbacteria bacterium]|nr:hypothetical protein [Candidatus Magasanikbacteria bacterium]